ncbi:hypothetical protein [Corticicoccus populi]|uniref:PH domain-containing protein n=1 Tax=Corticicoccus populi TaxID=1812821 RepID=A0ABW5WVG6_9STAP
MKSYQYTTAKFVTNVLLPVIIMIGLLIWGIFLMMTGSESAFAQVLIYGSSLLLLSSVVGIHTPSWIKFDDDKIIIHAFFVTHEFYWKDLSFAQIRLYKPTGKLYLRLGTKNILKGRYWISADMEGFDQLFDDLKEKSFLENKVSSLKR